MQTCRMEGSSSPGAEEQLPTEYKPSCTFLPSLFTGKVSQALQSQGR